MKSTLIDFGTRSILDLTPNYPSQGYAYINRICVPKPHRGQGQGRNLLQQVTEAADREGVILVLDINPYGEMDFEALWAWYYRAGFRSDPHERGHMHRLPLQKEE